MLQVDVTQLEFASQKIDAVEEYIHLVIDEVWRRHGICVMIVEL